MPSKSNKPYDFAAWFTWVDNPVRVRRVVRALLIFCAVLFVIDLLYHRHAYFGFEQSRGFYAISGFVAFAGIVILAGQLRRLIRREENYYSPESIDGEKYPPNELSIIDNKQRSEFTDSQQNESITSRSTAHMDQGGDK